MCRFPFVARRRRLAGFCCAVLVGFSLVATPAVVRGDAALDEYNLAVGLYKQNRWQLAADGFRQFLKQHAEHEKAPFAKLYLGLTLVNQADYAGARDILRTFVKESPQNQNVAQAKYRIAECSYLLNDLPAARKELEAYLADHPQDGFADRAWPYLGDVQLRLNDPAAAEQSFTTAVERFPQGPLVDDARFGWAKALDAQKKTAAALAKYQELVKAAGPRAAEAQFQIGARYFDEGQFPAAAQAYRDLAEKFPESPLAPDGRLNAGFAWYRAGQFDKAAAEFAAAGANESRAITAGYWQGLSLKGQGEPARAADVLKKSYAAAGKHPLAESILFQRGMCERLAGRAADAQATWLELAKQFPQGEFADDALHFAAELAIEQGDLDAAAARLAQFAKDHPRSGLRLHQELLAGRLELARAAQGPGEAAEQRDRHYAAAAERFQAVLKDSTLPKTRNQARYYLALTRQLQGDHRQALELIQPLVGLMPEGQRADPVEAHVLQADSLLQTGDAPGATAAIERYVAAVSPGKPLPRAWSLLALAQGRAGNYAAARQTLTRLEGDAAQNATRLSTGLQLAEQAEESKDWPAAAELYGYLQTTGAGTETEPFARRGLGWAQFQQRQFVEAARSFADLEQKFPKHRLAAEAAYYHAESLREAAQLPEAAAAFAAAWTRWAPAEPAPAGAEQRVPGAFAYRSGLQAARVRRQLKDVAAADAAYAALIDKFPQAQQLDRLLDEWALLNYEAERFDRADEIFQRLIKDVPNSDLADNARLSLAESDLLANRLDAARETFEQLVASERSDAGVQERALYQLVVLAVEQARWGDVRKLADQFLAKYAQSGSRPYIDYCWNEAVIADPQSAPKDLEAVPQRLERLMQAPAGDGAQTWHPRLWVLQAELGLRQKRYDDVVRTVADFRQQQPEAKCLYQADEVLGRAYKQQAKFAEARTAFERALADPAAFRTETAAKCQFLIAETYFLEEKWKEAFLAYQKVYTSYAFPDWQAAALLQSGKCDEQLKQWTEAVATYAQLLQEFPNSVHVAEAKRRQEAARQRAGK